MDRLLERVGSSSDLTAWMAADRLSPPVGEQVVYMIAQLCSLTYNANRGEDADPKSAQDFIPDYMATEEEVAEKRQKRLRQKMELQKVRMG